MPTERNTEFNISSDDDRCLLGLMSLPCYPCIFVQIWMVTHFFGSVLREPLLTFFTQLFHGDWVNAS